jgi:hypothetical protein
LIEREEKEKEEERREKEKRNVSHSLLALNRMEATQSVMQEQTRCETPIWF